ncbi:MAG: cyclic nucleotide-binding domain-containing protein [Acidobacteriota bacterium]
MVEQLRQADVTQGLSQARLQTLSAVARVRSLRGGEYLFLLGDPAHYLSVVVKGQVDLCFPMDFGGTVKDIAVESAGPGRTVGWSALVKPYRFTLSARATEAADVLAFGRQDLFRLFDADPELGRALSAAVAEIVGARLSMFQALWARELRRALETDRQRLSAG